MNQGSVTFTNFPPRTSTRFIIEPPSARSPGPSHFTLVVTYQTPSGTRGKEKLPEASQGMRCRVETYGAGRRGPSRHEQVLNRA